MNYPLMIALGLLFLAASFLVTHSTARTALVVLSCVRVAGGSAASGAPAVFAQRLERHVELLDMAGFLYASRSPMVRTAYVASSAVTRRASGVGSARPVRRLRRSR